MADKSEIERLAGALNCLRPEWPVRSLVTYLTTHHAHRAYTDLAVAAVHVATDPRTVTPARLSEMGPWWQTTASRTTERVGPGAEPRCEDHPQETARNCRCCRSEAIAEVPS